MNGGDCLDYYNGYCYSGVQFERSVRVYPVLDEQEQRT